MEAFYTLSSPKIGHIMIFLFHMLFWILGVYCKGKSKRARSNLVQNLVLIREDVSNREFTYWRSFFLPFLTITLLKFHVILQIFLSLNAKLEIDTLQIESTLCLFCTGRAKCCRCNRLKVALIYCSAQLCSRLCCCIQLVTDVLLKNPFNSKLKTSK